MTGSGDPITALAAARAEILRRIAQAAGRAGRDPATVHLLAVSKTVEADRLRAAVGAGLTEFGENRVQEGARKAPDVPGASFELIGPLQSNKARRAVEVFARIQTVDSIELAERLDRLAGDVRPGARYPVLLQVNVDDDAAKSGFRTDAVEAALPSLLDLPHLEVQGLMTVGRMTTDPVVARATFVALRTLGARLRARQPRLGSELSMGMTDDFELAIEEGATVVRVGRALFGERPHDHGGASHTHGEGGSEG